MKGVFIVNPSSGTQTHQKYAHDAARIMLKSGTLTEARFIYTTGKNSARESAASLKTADCDFVVAVGGDGTVNEVASGLVDSGRNIPMTLIKAGTTNDFGNALGIPSDVSGLVRMINEFTTISVDMGSLNGNYFLNVAAGGMLSNIAHNVSSEQKTALGGLAYYIEGVKSMGELKLDTVPLRFETNGFAFETETFLVVVANSKSVGGFQNIAPKAVVNDGKFDVCILKSIKPTDIVPVFTQVQMGTHIMNSKCVTYFQTDRLDIKTLSPNVDFSLDYDGECGGVLPAEIRVIPSALKVIVPSWKRKTKKLISENV